jgi:hypothetical protein
LGVTWNGAAASTKAELVAIPRSWVFTQLAVERELAEARLCVRQRIALLLELFKTLARFGFRDRST